MRLGDEIRSRRKITMQEDPKLTGLEENIPTRKRANEILAACFGEICTSCTRLTKAKYLCWQISLSCRLNDEGKQFVRKQGTEKERSLSILSPQRLF